MKPYFEILHIPNLSSISSEIAENLDILIPNKRFRRLGYGFNRVMPEDLLKASPSLGQYLESVGLKEHLAPSALPWAEPGISGAIHVDVVYHEGINLPVIGEGYGAWYDAEYKGGIKSAKTGGVIPQIGGYILCENAVEVARVSNSEAFWANTQIPHNGVNTGDSPRVILTLRFDVPITQF
jgi:hypothetical protein